MVYYSIVYALGARGEGRERRIDGLARAVLGALGSKIGCADAPRRNSLRGTRRPSAPPAFGRGDDTVGNPHRAQISLFEFFELILLLELDKQVPVEQFETAAPPSTVPSPPLTPGSWADRQHYLAMKFRRF